MPMMQAVVCYYYLVLNLISFTLFGLDKRRARRGKWRISERALLLSSVLGGAAGSLLAMLLFRHKTRKAKFFLTVPLLFALHLFLASFLFLRAGIALLSVRLPAGF